jgi:hypothetical protein
LAPVSPSAALARALKGATAEGITDPVEAAVRISGIDRTVVELAASYYADYPDDVDERIRTNEQAAERLRHVLESPPTQSAA